jgi:hypothetical protein
MDASLHTQSGHHGLTMRGIKLYADTEGGACFLEVNSHPFSAALNFYFDGSLRQFVGSLKEIDATLSGHAKLALFHEDPFLLFEGDGRGHVTVTGLLVEMMQKLQFSFVTDQTSLRPFIDALEQSYAPSAA